MKKHTLDVHPTPEDVQSVSDLFKALSDPTRLKLVLALQKGALNVTQLVDVLKQPQSTVSRHLATLRHAGLVLSERQNTSQVYRLSNSHLHQLLQEAFSHQEHQRMGLPDHPEDDQTPGSIH